MTPTLYRHPGKFEGELALAPLAYEISLDGFGESYDFGGDGYVDHFTVCMFSFEVDETDRDRHGLNDDDVAFAKNLLGFIVHETDSGFVSVSWYQKGDEISMARDIGKLDTEMGKLESDEC